MKKKRARKTNKYNFKILVKPFNFHVILAQQSKEPTLNFDMRRWGRFFASIFLRLKRQNIKIVYANTLSWARAWTHTNMEKCAAQLCTV